MKKIRIKITLYVLCMLLLVPMVTLADPNSPPTQPEITSPSDGSTGTSTNPAITSSSFSDLNQGGAEGLAAQWQFEGNALDETGNGNDGTIHGAVYTPGKAGQALGFDGVNDYALVSDSSSLDITQTLTMEAWVKLDSYPSSWRLILEKGDSGANRTYGMWIRNTGDILLSYYNDSWYHLYPAGQGFSLGGWHHVVGIIDTVNDYRAIYIDGVLKASDASSIPAMRSDTYPVYIGSCTGTWPTDGTIDEVAVYNRALSESEIQEHYQHGLNGEHNPVGTGGDTHASSDWEVFEDSGLTQLVWSSYDDTAHLTSTTVNSANGTFSGSLSGSTRLTMGNDYWARVRHTDDKGGDSLWSETNRFTTAEVDTDGDGVNDGDEVNAGTDPNDDEDYPNSPPAQPEVTSPSNGATGTATNPAVTSSSFSDPDQGAVEGLAAQWQFEGNALDETENGNDGTAHGAVYTPGKAGQALGFDGVNDYALVSDSSSLDITQTLTMEAWVKLDSYPSSWSLILEKGDSGANRSYGMWIRNTGDILLSYYNDSWYHLYPAGQGFSLGGWHHVVGIIDTVNDYRAIYIDGVLKASDASSIPAMRSDNYPVYIGSCTGTWPTDGTIDEVAVYNRALSESEIQEHYQHGLNGEHNPVGTGGDTHASSGWEVFEDSGLTQLVWSSYDDTAHLTSTTVNSANGTFSGSLSGSTRLTMGNDYWARVRHTDDKGGDSLWSETNRFTTTEVDTDGDGLNDDEDTDDDNDGLIDTVETNTGVYVDENDTGTDPLAADTDGDGVNDGDEVNAGTDPNDDEDYPNSPPAQPEVTSPSNGATGTATNPAVTSSSFSDPDQGAVEGLAAQWQFEGNALDETENGNDGTAHGPSYVAGRAGQALGFDGVNDYALVSDSSSLDITQTLTMEAWVKLDSYPSSWSLILEKGDSGANRTYGMWIRNTGDILLSYYNDSWYHLYPAGQGFSLGGWHHVVGIIDTVNDYRAIYIDGVLKASDTSSIPAMRSDNYPVYIGSCTGTWPTDGTIDEVAVYNRALSESEIQEHYQHGLNGEHNPVGTGGDTHASSGWEVFEDSGLTQLVWSSYDDTAHLTSTTVNSANGTFSGSLSGSTRLTMGEDYWVRVRHTDDREGDSPWSETNRFTTTEVDTDGDGLNDDEDTDDDNDGLIDTVETNTGVYVDENDTGTDPLAADTDGDGVNDGDEVNAGTDPNDDEASGTIYYVANNGNDENSGTSPDDALQTLDKINSEHFSPGDSILFKRNDHWRGRLIPQSGSPDGHITYGAYGTGNKPLFLGSIEINDLNDWTYEGNNIWATTEPETLGEELFANPSFDENADSWYLWCDGDANAYGSRDLSDCDSSPASYKIDCVSQGSEIYDIQLSSRVASISSGKVYKLKFRAKCTKPFTMAHIALMKDSLPWNCYYSNSTNFPNITTEWVTYTVYYKADASATDAKITFFLGGILPEDETFHIDSISFKECESENSYCDIGNIIFNNGQLCGVKKWNEEDLDTQGDFWYDEENSVIKIYSIDNPASYYSDIECALTSSMIDESNKSYVIYENLELKYGGAHGIGGGNTHHIIIKDCDLSYIGGGELKIEGYNQVRYGNGIEFWGNAHDNLVERCRLWEIYDSALTNQNNSPNANQYNICYQNNIIWNCEWSYEFWNSDENSFMGDISFINNTCVNAGGGWGHSQRPDPSGIHILNYANITDAGQMRIVNNIFHESTATCLYISPIYNGLENLYLDHNCWYQATGTMICLHNAYTMSQFSIYQSETSQDQNSMAEVPLFANSSESDFHLQEDSPAIDNGASCDAPEGDFDRNCRPQGADHDIGAYECDMEE